MDAGQDFEKMARQYWSAWGDMLRGAVPSAQPATPDPMKQWHDAVDWWTQLAHGQRSEVNAAVDRFNGQARSWYGSMQQVAAQFAGQDASARDITSAWKQALGAVGENPFPELFRSMRGQGQQGLDQWIEDASPFLDSWRREASSWLGMPAFGFAREQQERLQDLMQSQMDLQQENSAYNALMVKSGQRAYEVFEKKLSARASDGQQLKSARAMFDLWIDAAEEAYAEIALSDEFRKVYGRLVDAQMRVRGGVQRQVENSTGQLGMPTRTEVDSAHRKITQLEREVRKLRDSLQEMATRKPQEEKPAPQTATVTRSNEHSLKVQGDKLLGDNKPKAAAPTKAAPTKTAPAKAAAPKNNKHKGKGKRA